MNPSSSVQSVKKTIFQGEYLVSKEPGLVISTILGSCVAACLFDPVARVGGMNHFLLPGEADKGSGRANDYLGVHLMELLINGLLREGAERDRLTAKLFGGGRTIQGLSDIGGRNADFAQRFLEREGIKLLPGSLGGVLGRRIEFTPTTGRVRQSFMNSSDPEYRRASAPKPLAPIKSGDLELF
jgi:chemotaxis protein CheD